MAPLHFGLAIVIVAALTGCGKSSSSTSNEPLSDPAVVVVDSTGTTGGQINGAPGTQNPTVSSTPITFNSLAASNDQVRTVLETCQGEFEKFNAFFGNQPNTLQVATEAKNYQSSASNDAVQIQWVFTTSAVDTSEGRAVEANSAGATFSAANNNCGVTVFQGFGLNQDRTDTLVKFDNPSPAINACVDRLPEGATREQTYPLYEISGNSYGLYRHDYTSTSMAQSVTYQQVYETRFNGSSYFIHCPEPELISSQALLPNAVQLSLELVPDKTFRFNWGAADGAEFYRLMENADGQSGFNVVSEDITAAQNSYDHRVALYTKTNASYILQSCNALGCVDSDSVTVAGSLAQAVGYFKAFSDNDGERLASVSLDADATTMAIGAYGAVFVYRYDGSQWQQAGYLKRASEPDGLFGSRVNLSADGNTLAVSAFYDNSSSAGINGNQFDTSLIASGAVFIFVKNNETWEQQAYIKASNPDEYDSFGESVAISADGNTVVAGAYTEDSSSQLINGDESDNSSPGTGAAYVFTRSGTNWTQEAYLKANSVNTISYFGRAVSMTSDASLIVIGAYESVYFFSRDAQQDWYQSGSLESDDYAVDDLFADVLDISADGRILVVGARGDDNSATGVNGITTNGRSESSGAAYVFSLNDGEFSQQAYLKASNTTQGSAFGSAVSVNAAGDKIVVGAIREGGASVGLNGDQNDFGAVDSGAVYYFEPVAGTWQQKAYIKAPNTDNGDRFGSTIALSGDGNTLAIGAWGEDSTATGINGDQNDESGDKPGAVYLY